MRTLLSNTAGIVQKEQRNGGSTPSRKLLRDSQEEGAPSSSLPRPVSSEKSLPNPEVSLLALPKLRLLVVDDDVEVRRCIRATASPRFELVEAPSTEVLTSLSHGQVDVALLDIGVLQNRATALMNNLAVVCPRTNVVVMTTFATASTAMEAMRAGASDYLTKPFSDGDLQTVLQRAEQQLQRDFESRRLRESLRTDKGMGPLIGVSPGMERVYRILSKVALFRHPALILGESGTGKEAVARAIHTIGSNADKPFVVIDCAALPTDAAEAQLFGTEKSAMRKGRRPTGGMLTAGSDGTVFLDQVGGLPLDMQSKLLHVLQDRRISPVGAVGAVPICGTRARLKQRRSVGHGRAGEVSQGSLLPTECGEANHPAASGPSRGYPDVSATFSCGCATRQGYLLQLF
jgi:DNA-binding NtrC family response regulator